MLENKEKAGEAKNGGFGEGPGADEAVFITSRLNSGIRLGAGVWSSLTEEWEEAGQLLVPPEQGPPSASIWKASGFAAELCVFKKQRELATLFALQACPSVQVSRRKV